MQSRWIGLSYAVLYNLHHLSLWPYADWWLIDDVLYCCQRRWTVHHENCVDTKMIIEGWLLNERFVRTLNDKRQSTCQQCATVSATNYTHVSKARRREDISTTDDTHNVSLREVEFSGIIIKNWWEPLAADLGTLNLEHNLEWFIQNVSGKLCIIHTLHPRW